MIRLLDETAFRIAIAQLVDLTYINIDSPRGDTVWPS
jgi:hypothetical protein